MSIKSSVLQYCGILSIYLFTSLLLVPGPAVAANPGLYGDEPPVLCEEGTWRSGEIDYEDDIQTNKPIREVQTAGGQSEVQSFGISLDKLRVRANRHLLIGESVRVRGEGYHFYNWGDRVHFYDSLGGYRGVDTAGVSGNARLSYDLTGRVDLSGNEGWVWAMKYLDEYPPACSKQSVYFQEDRPSVSFEVSDVISSAAGPKRAELEIEGELDPYSNRGINGLPPTVEIWTREFSERNELGNCVFVANPEWVRRSTYSAPGTNYVDFSPCSSAMTIRMRASDGIYKSEWFYGEAAAFGVN